MADTFTYQIVPTHIIERSLSDNPDDISRVNLTIEIENKPGPPDNTPAPRCERIELTVPAALTRNPSRIAAVLESGAGKWRVEPPGAGPANVIVVEPENVEPENGHDGTLDRKLVLHLNDIEVDTEPGETAITVDEIRSGTGLSDGKKPQIKLRKIDPFLRIDHFKQDGEPFESESLIRGRRVVWVRLTWATTAARKVTIIRQDGAVMLDSEDPDDFDDTRRFKMTDTTTVFTLEATGRGSSRADGGPDIVTQQVIVVRESGLVGIGTASPSAKLAVTKASYEVVEDDLKDDDGNDVPASEVHARIAQKFGVTAEQLREANNLTTSSPSIAGQLLAIPLPSLRVDGTLRVDGNLEITGNIVNVWQDEDGGLFTFLAKHKVLVTKVTKGPGDEEQVIEDTTLWVNDSNNEVRGLVDKQGFLHLRGRIWPQSYTKKTMEIIIINGTPVENKKKEVVVWHPEDFLELDEGFESGREINFLELDEEFHPGREINQPISFRYRDRDSKEKRGLGTIRITSDGKARVFVTRPTPANKKIFWDTLRIYLDGIAFPVK